MSDIIAFQREQRRIRKAARAVPTERQIKDMHTARLRRTPHGEEKEEGQQGLLTESDAT